MTEPLPCPFCGEAPEVESDESEVFTAEYWARIARANLACPVMPALMHYKCTRDALVARWNTRAPAPGSLAARITALDELSRNAVLSTLEGFEDL